MAGFIEERQAKQVRALRQSWRVLPRLAIVQTHHDAVSDKYVEKKIAYANEILVEVDSYVEPQASVADLISKLNADESVHGIIVQLPIENPEQTAEIVNLVDPAKDVDGLGDNADYTPATVVAIDWLLSAYNIDLFGKDIVIVGRGRLVGGPLAKHWEAQGLKPRIIGSDVKDISTEVGQPDILVSATGVAGLITKQMIKPGAIVVDAGTSSENGVLKGDVSDEVRALDDITITPLIGGVGPLTIAALIDNVIRAARVVADKKGQQDL